jgi:hypothetical protein
MASDALKQEFKTTFADDFIKVFDNDADDQYFLVFGKVDSWDITAPPESGPYGATSENTPPSNIDSVIRSSQAWRDGVGAKRISSRNVHRMIPRIDWETGSTYDAYNDSNDMFGTASGSSPKRFYVHTSTGNVYKCLGNTGGAVSQFEPAHTISDIVTLEDGYKWKYIYKVTEDSVNFKTTSYLPIQFATESTGQYVNQWNSQQNSVDGAINDISVTLPSSGWTAAEWGKSQGAREGESALEVLDDSLVGSTDIMIQPPATSIGDDYYVGYVIYISYGPGMGQRRRITSYDATSKRVSFELPLTEDVRLSGSSVSQYKIMPDIIIDGDGISAEAIVDLNSDYQIIGMNMLQRGQGYSVAVPKIRPVTVTNAGGTTFGFGTTIQGPTLDAIISPGYGHGANALQDFQSDKIMIRTTVKGTDTNFVTGQDIRQVMLVKNPKISGGTYDGDIAGSEITRKKQLTVVKPTLSNINFTDTTFKYWGRTGDSIMGETSKATAKIQNWTPGGSDTTIGTLELTDVQGTFDLDKPESKLTRVIFSSGNASATGAFTKGRTVKQHNGLEGASGATAVGTVDSWSQGEAGMPGPYELIIKVSKNAFVDSSGGTSPIVEYQSDGTVGSISWAGTRVVERKMGELIKHFKSGQGSTFEFYVPAGNSYGNVARGNRITDVQDEDTLEKSYRLTTKIIIEDTSGSPSLTGDTYTKDDIFRQIDLLNSDGATTGMMTTGKIVDWSATSASTGELFLNDVRGNYLTGGFCGAAAHGITSVSGPEMQIGSGEVLYIQNIRPITRGSEQEEEIKILIGY